MAVECATLNNGAKLPLLGLGTLLARDPEELKVALRAALDVGYRLIDTAARYGNEGIIGEVLEEYFNAGKLKRGDVFITTKLPFTSMAPAEAEASIEKQLKALRMEYVDLYLIHNPCPMKPKDPSKTVLSAENFVHQDIPHIDTWKALEKYHKKGVLKAIGLSNFNAKQIQDIYDQAEVKPANLQVECHIYWSQFELHELCKKLNMTMTAYGPIGSPGRTALVGGPSASLLTDPLVVELAEKHGKSPAQVILRHLTQRGISVIPKSTNPKRVVENFQIFDFKLTPDEIKQLDSVDKRIRLFEFRHAEGHKNFPFEDVVFTKAD